MSEAFLHQLESAQGSFSGCLLCALETQQAARYLEGVANDGVNDPPLRARLSQAGGYCPRHVAVFVAQTYALPSAILLEDFLRTRLANARAGGRPTHVRCAACDVEHRARETLRQGVKRRRKDSRLHHVLHHAELCVTHLELVCRHLPDEMRHALTAQHDPLLNDLAEFIRKHDYRFTGEAMTESESSSVKRGVELYGAAKPNDR